MYESPERSFLTVVFVARLPLGAYENEITQAGVSISLLAVTQGCGTRRRSGHENCATQAPIPQPGDNLAHPEI